MKDGSFFVLLFWFPFLEEEKTEKIVEIRFSRREREKERERERERMRIVG